MVDSTVLCAVVDECAAWSAELVVEGDGCCEGEQALEDALSEPWEGACAVALEGEDVLAGPEDALDALAYRCEVRSTTGLVSAAGSEDRRVQLAGLGGELASGVALVADQCHRAVTAAASQQLDRDLTLILLGRGERERSGRPIEREDRVQPEPPEITGVRRRPAVVRGVRQLGAPDGLAAAGALHGGAVDQQQIVVESGALAGEHGYQPLERSRQATTALVVAGLSRQPGGTGGTAACPRPRGTADRTVSP
jgi:hypothetical protein